jgi:hypothetical protein
MRFPLDNVDSDDMEQTPQQTERCERGPKGDFVDQNLGRSDQPDDNDAGDIADEGTGRRG